MTNWIVIAVLMSFASSAFALDQVLDEEIVPQQESVVRHDYQVFLGASMGATSTSDSGGSSNRDTTFSYGIEGFCVWHHFAFGPSFKVFGFGPDGSSLVNVSQNNYWGALEGRYRFWDAEFSPYLSLGGGGVFQNISTFVMGNTNNETALYFSRDVGLGLTGKVTDAVGINVAARYYQYSNLNGFDYTLSLGFYL